MTIIIIPNEPNPNMTGRHYGIAKALIQAGHDVHTVMWDMPQKMTPKQLVRHLFTSLRRRDYAYEDIQMHHFGRLPLFWPYLNNVLFNRQLRKLFKLAKADFIFAESYTNETTVPADLPYIYDLADDYYAPAVDFHSLAYRLMFAFLGVKSSMKKMARSARAVTAVSEVLCSYARQYNSRVELLPNGIETDVIRQVLAGKQPKVNPHSLIYVSGFGPWSQPVKVIEAVVKLREDFPKIQLTLVGEGSEVPAILKAIKDNDAGSYITYRGFIHDRKKVFELINKHAIGLNISEKNRWRDAAHPMKVIEYSALGKKVVSTDLAGVNELALSNILTFSNDNPTDFRQALKNALLASSLWYPEVSDKILTAYGWQNVATRLITLKDGNPHNLFKPTITHVTPSYPPVIGGLEEVVQALATTQAQSGYRVTVLTSRSKLVSNTASDIRVQRFQNIVLANTIIMPGLLLRLLRIPRTDIVHLHITQALTPEMVWLASLIRGYSYVAHIHLDVPATGRLGILLEVYKNIFLKKVLRHSHTVIVPTQDYKNLVIERYGLNSKQITVIPNATNHAIATLPKKHPRGMLQLLFVGRLSPQKNLPLLLNAVAKYISTYSDDVSLTIIGNGSLKHSLQQQAEMLNIRLNVNFHKPLYGKNLEDLYAKADMFLLTSIAESFGLVLVEAMTKGLPIVSTDIPAVRNVVRNNYNGLLVKDDPSIFAKAMHQIASDKKLYEQISTNNLNRARDFVWKEVNARVIHIYNGML